jgi:predicted DNA-binding transcriptional regulator AlpA
MLEKNDIINMGFRSINDYPDILTPKDIGEILRLKRSTAYMLMSQPDFPSFRAGNGKLIRVQKGDLLRWISQRKAAKL